MPDELLELDDDEVRPEEELLEELLELEEVLPELLDELLDELLEVLPELLELEELDELLELDDELLLSGGPLQLASANGSIKRARIFFIGN